MSDESIFDYSSDDGVEYRLVVTKRGFILYDKKTDEQIVDASILIDNSKTLYMWPIELSISPTNRDHYFKYEPNNGIVPGKVEFGISRRN